MSRDLVFEAGCEIEFQLIWKTEENTHFWVKPTKFNIKLADF